ncbi:MAG TPA: 30S ribosomal protein S5 [Bacilli bacterium]|nr:30S ribosomal protein S5 [Bacilli bacterium]
MERKFSDQRKKEYDDAVIAINRITKVTKGGRKLRFSATVAVGNRNGKVGLGTGKANEVQEAIKKATQDATNKIINVSIIDNRTVSHEAIGEVGSARVLIKPAIAGTGIIAGGPVRAVLELAGVKDIISKSLGSNTQLNVARATVEALKMQRTVEKISELRGKTVEEILE